VDLLTDRLVAFWNGLPVWQRVALLGIPAVLVVGAVAALTLIFSTPPARAPLFRDLEVTDASRIVEELKRQNVTYTLENEGRDILVPAADVYDLRLHMAGMGLPQDSVGFELFDKNKLGITETGMRIDYQRALQGELQRTLEALEQVQAAKVILQIAPDTTFLDTNARSTASVALTFKSGERLSENQVEGIRHLVSKAVSRLDPEDVAIIDSQGNPLTGREDGDSEQKLQGLALAELQHRLRQRLERDMENKVRQFLEDPYGAGNVAASVSLEMDFRAINTKRTEYTPVVGDQGIESHVEEHRAKQTGSEETPGGVPGTTSNIPGYLGLSGGEGQATQDSEYNLIVEYLVNQELREEDLPPGVITRRSAAVAINTDAWDAATKQSVDALVASAIGANLAAGDEIDVQAFEFSEPSTTATVAAEYTASRRNEFIGRLAGWLLALLVVGAALVFIRTLVMGALPRELPIPSPAGALAAGGGLMTEEEAEEYALRKLDELSATAQDKMRSEIARMIDAQPERVASLLRSWLLEDT
jgi:flagellar M-ring protein FliF